MGTFTLLEHFDRDETVAKIVFPTANCIVVKGFQILEKCKIYVVRHLNYQAEGKYQDNIDVRTS
jgi:hypothetical protein